MKRLYFFAFIFIAVCYLSCKSNSANAVNNKMDAADNNTSTTSNSSSDGNAVFEYNLDDTKVTGGVVDALSINNAATITGEGDNKKLQFFLNDAYKDNVETFSHSLRFTIPDKTGTVTLTSDDGDWHALLFLATGEDAKYIMYSNTSFTITVTSISATKVQGTFSGTLKLIEGQGPGKSSFTVTNGKFDIPIRADKK